MWGLIRQRQFEIIRLFLFSVLILNPCTSLLPLSYAQLPASPLPGYTLSETLHKNQTGFAFETKAQQENLKNEGKIYAKIRNGLKLSDEQKQFIQNCDSDVDSSPFCHLLRETKKKSKESSLTASKTSEERGRRHRILDILKWMKLGEIEKLSNSSEQDLREALKKSPSKESIRNAVDSFKKVSQCQAPTLGLLLGSKLEEYLPDSEVRSQVIDLYENSAPCGDTEISAKAKFRLSLLHIWEGNCKAALPHLTSLITQTNSTDYRSRALFWQYQCGSQEKNDSVMKQAKDVLIQKYPFSLHTLLTHKDNKREDFSFSFQTDSSIQYRTTRNPELNRKVLLAETLIQIQESALAREIMEKSFPDLETCEPGFRLYVAVLHDRLNQYLKKFKVLNSVFRDHPGLISRPAIELYYSQNTLPIQQLARIEVDGMLLLSLIRQESAFNIRARSPAGALGLMQVMPTTARRVARIRRASELLDPNTNIRVGSKYFSHLMRNYNGDAELALAAYNAGPHRVDQWLRRYPVKDRILFLDLIPFKETREYVASIARNYFWYVTLYPPFSPKLEAASALQDKKGASRSLAKVFSLFGT
jgi:soluble lytic murein transglycosylase